MSVLFLGMFLNLTVQAKIIETSVSFDGVGNEKLRKCASFDCDVIKYGGILPKINIIESSEEWYKIEFIERGYFDQNISKTVELPKEDWNKTTGWIYYTLVPEGVILQISNPKELPKDKFIGLATLNKESSVLNCPSDNDCTLLTHLKSGAILEVIDIDETKRWYKVELDNTSLKGLDKWIKSENFTNDSQKLINDTLIIEEKSSSFYIVFLLKKILGYFSSNVAVNIYLLIIILLPIFYILKTKKQNYLKPYFLKKRFLNFLTLLIIGIFLSFLYFFYKDYENNSKLILDLKQEITEIKNNNEKDKIDDEIEQKDNSIKTNFYPPTIVSSEKTINDVVKEWGDAVVVVNCRWYSASNGSILSEAYGSGFLFKASNGDSFVNTNKHVVYFDEEYKYISPDCDIVIPKYNEVYNVSANESSMIMEDIVTWGEFDFAQITIDKPTYSITQASKKPALCLKEPEIGDRVAILGFPAIGSSEGLTVTDGIISGFEGFYYVTSAKIDSGNSGGAAILLKSNCYLGMPTSASIGGAESLGRILDVRRASDAFLGE